MPMKQQTKLSQEQQHVEMQKSQAGREFTGTEELLRFDAAQTKVPPAIAGRLKQSAQNVAPTPRSWWKILLGQ